MPPTRSAICCVPSVRPSPSSTAALEALASLEAFKPDAALLDIGMPEMDGYEVSRRIRASSAHGDILLIALTGWGQEKDQRLARAAGFDHHLVKPPDLGKLREILSVGWRQPARGPS